MRRILLTTIILLSWSLVSPGIDSVQACPMCREANKTDDLRPKAYMYSILFMLAVPATVLTSFGIGFYRLSKKQDELLKQDGELL